MPTATVVIVPVMTPEPVAAVVTVPVEPVQPIQSACLWSPGLIPVLDDEGNQLYVDTLPAWLTPDGAVMAGELCPLPEVPVEAPVVPVQLPATGDGSTYGGE